MTLHERIITLCESRGVKGGKMCTDIGISKSTLTDLKMGRKNGLSAKNAQKIASYLGVTVGYLLGETENEIPAEQIVEQNKNSKEDLLNVILRLHNDAEFLGIVEFLNKLDEKQFAVFKQFIDVFVK